MRMLVVTIGLAAVTGCGILPGGGRDRGPEPIDIDTGDFESLFIRSCDLTCDQIGIDIEVDVVGADSAAVDFWSSAVWVETFELAQLDSTTWVAYPEWPAGYGFADCGASADFVCVGRRGDEEVREAQ